MKNGHRFGFGLAAVALLGARSSQAQIYATKVTYAATNKPVAVRLWDVNGDGLLDLLALGQSPGTLVVIESATDGTYMPATTFTTGGTQPVAFTVHDFDGDGSADVAVANGSPNDVVILFGDGKGAFSAPVIALNLNGTPTALESGDLDNDGDQDLVVAFTTTLRSALNSGGGVFALKTSGPAVSAVKGLSMGPLSGGPYQDVVLCHGSSVSIYTWNGPGNNFVNTPINLTGLSAGTPVDTAIGDLDGDADLDIVVGIDANPSNIQAFLRNGGSFTAQPAFPAGGNGLTAIGLGDADKNGFLDAVATLGSPVNEMSLIPGSGGGGFFGPQLLAAGNDPVDVAVGDADGDSDPDVITANNGSADISYFRDTQIPSVFFGANTHCGTGTVQVAFTDKTVPPPTSWLWTFGDGFTSVSQNPNHNYISGTFREYDVSLKVQGQTTHSLAKYITVFQETPSEVLMGLGPGLTTDHPPRSGFLARDCAEGGYAPTVNTVFHYGTAVAGVNVDGANLDGAAPGEFLTGPGNVAVFGPHVRGWQSDGITPVAGVSFFAYGTLKFGVKVRGGQLDADAFGEILTGAGQGAVFGPHVRGWNFDNLAITAMKNVSFFAYPGTTLYGVNVDTADLDNAGGDDELLTGPVFASSSTTNVRGWNVVTGGVTQLFSFQAFNTPDGYGVTVAGGDIDGDGYAEIIAGRGQGSALTADVRGFNYDNSSVTALSNVNFTAWTSFHYGATVDSGNVDGDGFDEILVAPGPDPAAFPEVKGYNVDGSGTPVSILGLAGANPFAATYPLARYGATLGISNMDKVIP